MGQLKWYTKFLNFERGAVADPRKIYEEISQYFLSKRERILVNFSEFMANFTFRGNLMNIQHYSWQFEIKFKDITE